MAILVTAIHVLATQEDMDARDTPAHDGVRHFQRDTHWFYCIIRIREASFRARAANRAWRGPVRARPDDAGNGFVTQ
jgi:hypothetical protein